jgi:hypothetical protein
MLRKKTVAGGITSLCHKVSKTDGVGWAKMTIQQQLNVT